MGSDAAPTNTPAAQALWTAAFDHGFDAMVRLDAQGRIRAWNPQAERCFGWFRDEVLGQRLHDVVLAPSQRPTYLRSLQRHVEQGTDICNQVPMRCEGLALHRTGIPIAVEIQLVSVGDADVPELLLLRDISERKRTEEALRIAATAFQTLEGMVVTDADKVIVRVNDAFTQITGYAAHEALGKVSAIFRMDRHDEAVYHAMRRLLPVDRFWQGEVWDRRKNGEEYPAWLRVTAVADAEGKVKHYVIAFIDNAQQHRSQERLQYLALFDPLTGLPNRRLLLDRLGQILAGSARKHEFGALLLIDLDHFRYINDTLGHEVGDTLLAQAAQRIRDGVHADDTVARLGGDEYVVVLSGLADKTHAAASMAEGVAERLRDALAQPYAFPTQELQISPSIGITLFYGQDVAPEDLLKHAETAMYRAKAAGRNCLRFFDTDNQSSQAQRFMLNTWMRQGLPQQFTLHYQLQVGRTGMPQGAEALLRWKHPTQGHIAPNLFIPLAEETGFIVQLGDWVLEQACRQLAQWSQLAETKSLTLAVNVSARQFHVPSFVDTVTQALQRSGAPGQQLKLELTEGVMLHDIADVVRKMNALRALGVRFSIDDFGTGYSSLSYLKQLPLDQLKIDQTFVRDLAKDANDVVIARSIVGLGHSLGLSVIAEGVETSEQRDVLLRMQCDAFQGYYFGRPLAVDEFVHQLHALSALTARDCAAVK